MAIRRSNFYSIDNLEGCGREEWANAEFLHTAGKNATEAKKGIPMMGGDEEDNAAGVRFREGTNDAGRTSSSRSPTSLENSKYVDESLQVLGSRKGHEVYQSLKEYN